MDSFIEQLPFFTPEHRTLASDVASFVEQEIEPRAIEERDVDERLRDYVSVLATPVCSVMRSLHTIRGLMSAPSA